MGSAAAEVNGQLNISTDWGWDTMFDTYKAVSAGAALRVCAFSTTEWLISDPSLGLSGSDTRVGFIQRVGGSYEVTKLATDRVEFYSHVSFDDAMACLTP